MDWVTGIIREGWTMKRANARTYSDDMRKLAVELASAMTMEEMLKATSLKRRTLERLLSTYRHTGKYRESPKGRKGRPSAMTPEVTSVSLSRDYKVVCAPFTDYSIALRTDHSRVHCQCTGNLFRRDSRRY